MQCPIHQIEMAHSKDSDKHYCTTDGCVLRTGVRFKVMKDRFDPAVCLSAELKKDDVTHAEQTIALGAIDEDPEAFAWWLKEVQPELLERLAERVRAHADQ